MQSDNIGIGSDEIEQGESSNVFYKKERFRVKETNIFGFFETPNKITKGWDAAYNRFCTYAFFKGLKKNNFFGFLIRI